MGSLKMPQTQTKLSFDVSRADGQIIKQIADRAALSVAAKGLPLTKLDILMDLSATHASGCPLRLYDLLKADESHLLHDLLGINRHLDRETGQLCGCFLPRFAA
jgi:hypothetical protein